MGQPVKLSDALILDARFSAELTERSIAGQIEFWAGLGRAIEPLLHLDEVLALKKSGQARPLADCLNSVGGPAGRKQLQKALAAKPFPHYEPAADRPGYLVRISKDGSRVVGRFVNRKFTAARG
ncbi:hypothetical protein BH09VER1_BH09VER1_50540 [soil metagenome]